MAATPVHRVSPVTRRLVQVLGMQITISWTGTAGPPTTFARTPEISLHGPRARLTLTRSGSRAETPLPLVGQQPSRLEQSPYVTASLVSLDAAVSASAAVISGTSQMFGLTNINAAQIRTNRSIANSFQLASSRLISTAEAVHRLLKTSNRTPPVYTDREVH